MITLDASVWIAALDKKDILSWDIELNDRARGITPADWLAGQA